MFDVTIIGCGIVGAATAQMLARYQLRVGMLEKENDVSMGTTKANSAIIHSGYDPLPGTLMAKLNVRGAELTKRLTEELGVDYRQVGSLTLAFTDEEIKTIQTLYERGLRNGVPGIQILSPEEVRSKEKNLSEKVKCALFCPTAGILMPWRFAIALAENAVLNGAQLHLNTRVTGIERAGGIYTIHTGKGDFETRYIINAAGVHADEIHCMVAPKRFEPKLSRGQYYLLDKCSGDLISTVVFQCPTAHGKGVLVAPTIDGNLIVGPNAEPVEDGDDVATTAAGLEFVLQKAALSVPSLNFRDSIRNFAGVRAASDQNDFIIEEAAPGFIDAAGIKSPGLSSAPAIAEYIRDLLQRAGLPLALKKSLIKNEKRIEFKKLSPEEKNTVIHNNPLYGRIICRCETVSEGEIVDALHSPVPPSTIDGVKRRCNAGLGRCQGGFCGPRVHEIIARERKMNPKDVLKDQAGTVILTGETKAGGVQ